MSNRNTKGQFLPGTHWRPHASFREADFLRLEYTEKKRSAADIAREFSVHENSILFWLSRHEIPRRAMSQVRKIKRWGSLGSSNPMFGRTGRSNPRYVDGSSPQRQRLYAGSAWKEFVRKIYRRDGFCCQRRGATHTGDNGLCAHHLRPWAGNPDVRMCESNVVTLCVRCHRWVHSNANAGKEWLQ